MSETPTRPVQGPALLPWAVAGGAILALQVGGKAVRDGLFLSQVPAVELPRAMLVAALLAVPIVLGVSYAITRHGPGRIATWLLLGSAFLFSLEWLLVPVDPVVAAWLLYLHTATLGGTTISAFFSCIAERFDPHSARAASGRVTSGAAIGGLIGGILVSVLADRVEIRTLLLGLALGCLVCAIGLVRIGIGSDATAPSPPPWFFAVSFAKSSYLRSIAYLVLLTGFTSALLDYGFKVGASNALGTGPELLQLFAAFHAATALLTALVQVGLASRALERLGLAATLATLPASVLLTGALGSLVPPLWSRMLMRGASSVLESSLFRSAYEPLYTPLSQRTRRGAKTLIDVAAGRLGEALGSGSLLILALLLPAAVSGAVLVIAMAGSALALLLSLRLHGGYIAALTASLRKGSVELRDAEVMDSTTRLTLSQTHAELTRADLLAQLALLRASLPAPAPSDPARQPLPSDADKKAPEPKAVTSPPGGPGAAGQASARAGTEREPTPDRTSDAERASASSEPPHSGSFPRSAVLAASAPPSSGAGTSSAPPSSAAPPGALVFGGASLLPPATESDAALVRAVSDLLSGDRARVLRVLQIQPLDSRLVGFAIPLLAHSSLVEPLTAALKKTVAHSTGQLVDAMQDPQQPLVVRRRIPRILKGSAQPQAVHGLVAALRAPERELRHRAATALAELTASYPELAPQPPLVFELVREELRLSGDEPVHLHHVFAILSLALERDTLRFTRRALSYGDARQRGTALEYLHNTLPDPLRSELVGRLESGPVRAAPGVRTSRPPTV